jgi:hypothetical protein
MRTVVTPLFALCGLMSLAEPCSAQFPGQGPPRFGGGGFGGVPVRPTVSPYLNLLNSGDTAINYYGLVRPQLAFNRAIQNLGNDINFLESNPAGNQQFQQSFQTGNRATFMTQYRYFMTNGYASGPRPLGAGGAGGYSATAPAAPPTRGR